jgi:hypothetical protein
LNRNELAKSFTVILCSKLDAYPRFSEDCVTQRPQGIRQVPKGIKMKLAQALRDHKGVIEKVAKRKNWIGGKKGWGMKVKVDIVEVDF